MNQSLTADVKDTFIDRFQTSPLMVFSPGRINLIGEHTDYNDGFVFPAAIDKGVALAIGKSEEATSKLYAINIEEEHEFDVEKLAPIDGGGWRNYILGVISEIQKLGHTIGNFNAVFAGDVPGGAGLSSSAALENSFAFGLNELFQLGLTRMEMIHASQYAEHHYVGVKCGIMDQYASMFGVEDSALLLDCRTVTSQTCKIDFDGYKIMLINTNVSHNLSDSAYNDRRAACERVAELLGVRALRDANLEDLAGAKDSISPEDYQKASYVIEENSRANDFYRAVENNDLKSVGDLLYASHEGLSEKYQVSCEELDFLVEKAKENPAIIGSRMMGGGFGGCTISLILESDIERYSTEISKLYKEKFGRDCSIYTAKLSAGTRLI